MWIGSGERMANPLGIVISSPELWAEGSGVEPTAKKRSNPVKGCAGLGELGNRSIVLHGSIICQRLISSFSSY